MGFLNTSFLSAINLANREPLPSLLSSSRDCGRLGRLGKEGPGLGDSGGINAHTEERCSFGLSRSSKSDIPCMSVEGKESVKELANVLLFSVNTLKTLLGNPYEMKMIGLLLQKLKLIFFYNSMFIANTIN